jgi:hypothetical protein
VASDASAATVVLGRTVVACAALQPALMREDSTGIEQSVIASGLRPSAMTRTIFR